jgi:hypothetical protein
MYAFRKPFSAAQFSGTYWGLDYKVVLVLAQLTGYTVSKFLGIKFVSEAKPARRAATVLLLISIAEIALVLFAVVPKPWNAACLFVNGLPLGMVWGLIFGFLEGRRVTEFMGIGLSLSLIFSSGWVKAAGLYVMHAWGTSELWMPAVTGAIFLLPLLAALWMLGTLPPPDEVDVAARTMRQPMGRSARRSFLSRYWVGVVLFVAGYMGLMTYRDVRDTFEVDLLRELGVAANSASLAGIETLVGIAVMVTVALLALIRDNRNAFKACCALIGFGGVVVGAATAMRQVGWLGPQTWMIATGFGLYLGFVPYQAILFERLLANLQVVSTAVFLIALCDSYGYLSTIALYFYKVFGAGQVSWVRVLSVGGYALGILVPLTVFAGAVVFTRKREQHVKRSSQMLSTST